MKGQRTKQQNRSALLTITVVLLMLVVTMIGLTAVVSADVTGQEVLDIKAEYFEGEGITFENGIFSKEYNGTTDASLTAKDDAGLPAGVSINVTSATFGSANAGDTTLTVTYEITGENAWKYGATGAAITFNAKITPKTLSGATATVTYNPNGITLNECTVGNDVISLNALNIGVINANAAAEEITVNAISGNYFIPTINVKVNPVEIDSVLWVVNGAQSAGDIAFTYGSVDLKAFVNFADTSIMLVLDAGAPNAQSWANGNAGTYSIKPVIPAAYNGNYVFANGADAAKEVKINPLKVYVSMSDSTVIGDGKNNYSISVDGYIKGKNGNQSIPAEALAQVKYQVNGSAFTGLTYGKATVDAIFTNGNYEFLNKDESSIQGGKLTATLKVLRNEKIFDVLDEDGTKVGEVILASPDGFSDEVIAKVTALKGFPKITKNKYNMVYNVKIENAENQTFTLYIPLTETVFGSRIDALGVDTLCVYEAATKTLTSATKASKGYTVMLGEGFYQVDGFAGEATFVIAPDYNAPFFQTVWGILLIIVLVIAILVTMCYVGLYLRRILETREATATVIDTIGELPESEPVETKEEIDVDAVVEENLNEIAESIENEAEESEVVDEAALDEAVEESIQALVEEATEIVLDEEPVASEEVVEDVVATAAEEVIEEAAEEVVETAAEEVVEAPVEEIVEAAAEEVVEAAAEEVVEAAAEEVVEAAAEEVVEAAAEEVVEAAAEEVVEAAAEEVVTDSDDDNDDNDDNDDGDDAVEAVSMVEDDDASFGFGANVDPSTFVDVKDDAEAYQAMLDREARGEIKIVYRYKKSFQSKLAQSQGNVQDYYSELKNALLTFKGVKNRLSWNYEAFNKGRAHVAKMDAKSKTLYLYLALDPAQFAETKYSIVDVSGKRKYATTPTLMKIKGERKFKHALELIEKLCGEQLELVKVEAENVDYRVERMTIDEMVDAGLMKKSAGYVVLSSDAEAVAADAQVETAPEQN